MTLAGGGASAEAMWGPLGGPLWIAHDPSKNIDKLRGVAVYAAASGGGQGAVDRLPDGFGNNFAGGLIEGIVAANTKIFADAAAAGGLPSNTWCGPRVRTPGDSSSRRCRSPGSPRSGLRWGRLTAFTPG